MKAVDSYLFRSHYGVYYFRIVIPLQYRYFFDDRKEIKRSLETKDKSMARAKLFDWLYLVKPMISGGSVGELNRLKKAIYEQTKSGNKLSLDHVHQLNEKFISKFNSLLDLFTLSGDLIHLNEFLVTNFGENASLSTIAAIQDYILTKEGDSTKEYQSIKIELSNNFSSILSEFSVSGDHQVLAKNVLWSIQDVVESYADVLLDLTNNNKVLSLPLANIDINNIDTAQAQLVSVQPAHVKDRVFTILEGFELFKNKSVDYDIQNENKDTKSQYLNSINLFVDLFGDIPLPDITSDHMDKYRNVLDLLPSKRKTIFKNKAIGEVLDEVRQLIDEGKQPNIISSNTRKNTYHKIYRVLKWWRREQLIDNDFSHCIGRSSSKKNKASNSKKEVRESISSAMLNTIFHGYVYDVTKQKPDNMRKVSKHLFWLPLFGLFSGARENELAQLMTDDVIQDEETGIWYFRIVENNARFQKTKNASSIRCVPLHPKLIELGFLDYLQMMQTRSNQRRQVLNLWGLTHTKSADIWHKNFSESYRKYRGFLGLPIGSGVGVFHTFRNTFIREIMGGGDEDFDRFPQSVKQIIGHKYDKNSSSNSDIISEAYFGRLELSVLYDKIVSEVHYKDLSLDHVNWHSFSKKYGSAD